jgi:DNA helicase HerA-like ATPase
VLSYPDKRKYVGFVSSGPFSDPDGIRADSTAMIVSAVSGAISMPNCHGRIGITILGMESDGRIGPANRRPLPNSPVFTVNDSDMAKILNLTGDFSLGVVAGHEKVDVPVPVRNKSVLYRHTAVLGTTGGGKSTTVSNFIGGLQSNGVAIILLDTEGEYTTMNEVTENKDMLALLTERKLTISGMSDTVVYRLVGREASNPKHPANREFGLEFPKLSPWAIVEILGLNDAQQTRFFSAYDIARRLLVDLKLYPSTPQEQQRALDWDEMEEGYPKLTLALLIDVVAQCIAPNEQPEFYVSPILKGNKAAQQRLQGIVQGSNLEGVASSWKKVSSMLWKLWRLKIFDQPGAKPMDFVDVLKPGRVNIIDLSDLESPVLRNLAIAQILRDTQLAQESAYEVAQKEAKTPTPVNIVIEEAHEFLSTGRIRQMPTLYEQVAKIAKRGRKRWLGLTFVTQLPQNLPDEVIALVNNWILHKIQDESVVSRLRRTLPAIDQALWRTLANLQPGQAVVTFTHMRRPILTTINPSPYRLRLES